MALGAEDAETAVVVLAGGDLQIERLGMLAGRPSPFDGLPGAAYIPAGCNITVGARNDCDVAIARAPSSRDSRPRDAATEPILINGTDIEIEVRGAGNASRQINHIVKPEFPAHHLLLVEVFTPSGNWSSWPPHKHDADDMPTEAVLEEVYSYRFRRPEAWAIQRIYRRPESPATAASGPRDALFAVRHGDVAVVTDGYHPFAAAHGDDAYYLNALAGDRRTMACSFDPDLDWVRDSWARMAPDPRLPLVAR
jgi:5-deoxy-glucuronate isomerase